MKVKQFLGKFWYGASTISRVEIFYCSNLLKAYSISDVEKGDLNGFENELINSFKIKDNVIQIYLKIAR